MDLSATYPIQFVDIYSGNRWNAAEEKAKGTRGVIIKAGQGGWSSVPRQYVSDCHQVGLPFGFYWLIDSRYDSGYHMGAIKSTFPDKNFGALGMWWDCEKPRISMTDKEYWTTPYAGNGLIEAVTDKFLGWCGKTGGMYSNLGFAGLVGWNSILFKFKPLYKKLSYMPLWAAQYNNFIPSPTLFGPWKNWLIWQYRPEPDYNYFNGDEEKFQAFMAGNPIPEPPPVIPPLPPSPETGENIMKGTAITTTNIKSMAGGSTPVKVMKPGDYVFGTLNEAKTDLMNFDHYYLAAGTLVPLGGMCKATAGTNMKLENVTEPNPPDPDPNPTPVTPPPFCFIQFPDANGVLQPGKYYDLRP